MSAADKHICYNCFQETGGGDGPCPWCGFDLEENEKKYPTALRAGTVLNRRYTVGRVLGQGGFGITYLAWDQNLDAKVAVKEYMPGELADRAEGGNVCVMSADRQDEFAYGAERFKEEAAVLAKFMGQPGIAGVTDRFDENGTSYFVMDYIEGISFKTYIANAGGKVKLLDFGSARYSMGDKSKSLDVILKVGYAPKEQYIRRGRQGPYTDVYSCAACFYAAITGYLPPESLERLDHDTLIPPSEAGVKIPLYLERAILKGLAVQPEDRFQTAEEFLEAIETQQVVELPGEKKGQISDEISPAGSAAGRRRRPVLIGAAVLGIAAVFAVGIFSGSRSRSPAAGTGPAAVSGPAAGEQAGAESPTVLIGGEEYSTDLTRLDLREMNLNDSDLAGLAEMTNLEELDLRGNEISNLSPLSGLTNLRELRLSGDISGNEDIQDLTPLKNLVHLKVLHLPAQNIEDLTPLSGLTQLENLAFTDESGSPGMIEDITPLSSLVNLKELFLKVSSISDLSPLSGMTGLESLRIRGTSYISDLSPLSGLTHLKELELPAAEFSDDVDLTPLSGLSELEKVKIGGVITDLSPAAHVPGASVQ